MKLEILTLEDFITECIEGIFCDGSDYPENYDYFLADDYAYSPEPFKEALENILGEKLKSDEIEFIADHVIQNPTGYCDIQCLQKVFPHSEPTALFSFPIGELEFQVDVGPFAKKGKLEYLNRNTDYCWRNDSCGALVYCNEEYSTVSYRGDFDALSDLLAECRLEGHQ